MKLQNEMFTVVSETAGEVCVRLHADHFIYQAHFPGNPITPGVCIVQMICEILQNRLGRPLSLAKIVNLKFVSVINPIESHEITIKFGSVVSDDNECKAKGVIEANGCVKTKFSLLFVNKE